MAIFFDHPEVVQTECRDVDWRQLPEQHRHLLRQFQPCAGVDHNPPIHLIEGGEMGMTVHEDGNGRVLLKHLPGGRQVGFVPYLRRRLGHQYVVPVQSPAQVSQENPEWDRRRDQREQQEQGEDAFEYQYRTHDLSGQPQGIRQRIVQDRVDLQETKRFHEPAYHHDGADPEQQQERQQDPPQQRAHLPVEIVGDGPRRDLRDGHDRLHVLEPVAPPELRVPARRADYAGRDEIAHGLGVWVTEVGHMVALVVLLAVLYPDLPSGYLSRHGNTWDEVEVVILQTVDKFRVAGQLVVVVTGHERDRYLASRLLELLEQPRLLPDQRLEFLRTLERRELPQPEGVPVDDKL